MKMKELSTILEELISCSKKLTETAQALKDYYSATAEDKPSPKAEPVKEEKVAEETPAEPEVKSYTKEDVRALLSQKAKINGCKYKTEVKSLVAKYSSDGTLTKVPAEKYAELMAELEVVGNA